jgi:glycyl-tRNA synthetase beta chain
MPELLIELFSEEIPARMQARAGEEFCASFRTAAGALLAGGEARAFWGPRRITLVVTGLAGKVPGQSALERGPRLSAPEAAMAGFLKRHGAAREALVAEGDYWVLRRETAAEPMPAWLARVVPGLIRKLAWPKSMRWNSAFPWVRPLRRVLCVFDGAVVPFVLGEDAPGIVSGDLTEGHRVQAPGAFAVHSFAQYEAGLRQRSVVLDAGERARIIEEGLARLAAERGFAVVPDVGLLWEVAGLVEWPVPLMGRIDDAFMDLPLEVMRTTMRVNQKYFSLVTPSGEAAPAFGVVANIAAEDGGAAIIAGNERVLRARLSDARFFWDQDRKQTLESFLPKLDTVVFHAKLGTQGQRVVRLEELAAEIATRIGADAAQAARAAKLAKADLASGMVGEFPELQGVMGRYYALADGENAQVAEAVGTHYRPLGPGDAVPSEPISIALALADKVDQLVAFFRHGEKPTGSGDPYALRRAGLGVIRLIRENTLRLSLRRIILDAYEASDHNPRNEYVAAELLRRRDETVSNQLSMTPDPARIERVVVASISAWPQVRAERGILSAEALQRELLDFLADRLRVQLRAEGARHDILAAVFAAGADDDLVRLLARTEAVRAFLETDAGTNLLAAAKRAQNILRIEEKKEGAPFPPGFTASEGAPEQERALAEALATARNAVTATLASEDFAGAMTAMAQLRTPLDAFFEHVIVNHSDNEIRHNRLQLLSGLRAVLDEVADFSKIEG